MPVLTHFRKHEAKHSKPYICQVPNCKHTRFGDKSGLDRHNREVHGSQTHCCPITSCKRYVRGFPRKYNLAEHLKRCHSSQSPNLAPSGQQESYDGGASSEMVIGGGGWLREKLANLHEMRAEIDVDIKAVERCLEFQGESSPR